MFTTATIRIRLFDTRSLSLSLFRSLFLCRTIREFMLYYSKQTHDLEKLYTWNHSSMIQKRKANKTQKEIVEAILCYTHIPLCKCICTCIIIIIMLFVPHCCCYYVRCLKEKRGKNAVDKSRKKEKKLVWWIKMIYNLYIYASHVCGVYWWQ